MKSAVHGGGDVGSPDPNAVGDCHVMTSVGGTAMPLSAVKPKEQCLTKAPEGALGVCPDTACDGGETKPVLDSSILQMNAGDWDGREVCSWYPKQLYEDLDASKYTTVEAIECLAKHVSSIWGFLHQLSTALNHNHAQNHAEFIQIFGLIQALLAHDVALQACLNTAVAPGTGIACTIPTTAVSYEGPCEDYCAVTPPSVDCDVE